MDSPFFVKFWPWNPHVSWQNPHVLGPNPPWPSHGRGADARPQSRGASAWVSCCSGCAPGTPWKKGEILKTHESPRTNLWSKYVVLSMCVFQTLKSTCTFFMHLFVELVTWNKHTYHTTPYLAFCRSQIFITLLAAATADETATVSLFQNPENLRQLVVQVN